MQIRKRVSVRSETWRSDSSPSLLVLVDLRTDLLRTNYLKSCIIFIENLYQLRTNQLAEMV